MTGQEYKTTEEHFKAFESEARKWIKIFGLISWRIYFTHEKDGDRNASVTFIIPSRVATFNLNPIWKDVTEVSDQGIRRAGFHEVAELLLGRLSIFSTAEDRRTSDIEVDEEVHSIIFVLESILWEPEHNDDRKQNVSITIPSLQNVLGKNKDSS